MAIKGWCWRNFCGWTFGSFFFGRGMCFFFLFCVDWCGLEVLGLRWSPHITWGFWDMTSWVCRCDATGWPWSNIHDLRNHWGKGLPSPQNVQHGSMIELQTRYSHHTSYTWLFQTKFHGVHFGVHHPKWNQNISKLPLRTRTTWFGLLRCACQFLYVLRISVEKLHVWVWHGLAKKEQPHFNRQFPLVVPSAKGRYW